jgi:diguanylate cyclase (GGDEF)-like protein
VRDSGSPKSAWYAIAGAILALGAPTGLLLLRELYAPRPLAAELASDRLTYVYVLVSTAIVLAVLGYVLGRQADRLEALSETDALTGIANRRALRRRLEDEFRRSARYGSPVSLLVVDIDGLKRLNDTHGHAAGDRTIRAVADAITRGLRGSDLGARWGGDEFAVLAPNTSAHAAHVSAERLVARVASHRDPQVLTRPTVSVGVATHDPAEGKYGSVEELVRAADSALYRAKTSGRNRVNAA